MIANPKPTRLGEGYDVTESTNRRRQPRALLQSEDNTATKLIRQKLVATGRDARRNFSTARWMINKHLDFVVSHNFRAKTGDASWDTELETFFKYASHKTRYDATGKHPRRRFMRILEASRTVDGDVFPVKIRGGPMQAVEGDRCRDPDKVAKNETWCHGVRKNQYGVATHYAFHKRNGTRFEFERTLKADSVIPFGYYDRFDQTRGISPMAPALRELGDVYEGFDYALAREKVNQLFTFLITRDSTESLVSDDDADVDEPEPYKVDFSKGPNVLDLDPGDDAKFLTAQGTTDQSQKFWDSVTGVALKALDIPFSFYREDFTNFFGSRAALMVYLKSCKWKRDDVVDFEDEWFRWRLREGEVNGEILIPSSFDVENAVNPWQFIPDGVPWWNPAQEVKANIDAVDNYQRSRSEIRQEQFGDDWFDMMDVRTKEDDWLDSNGYKRTEPTRTETEPVTSSDVMSMISDAIEALQNGTNQ